MKKKGRPPHKKGEKNIYQLFGSAYTIWLQKNSLTINTINPRDANFQRKIAVKQTDLLIEEINEREEWL